MLGAVTGGFSYILFYLGWSDINSPLWIIYNILVGSWAGIMDEVVSETSMITSIVRYGWENLGNVED